VELELWPNFIAAATRRQIPIVLINGRVSDRSYRSYRWIRPLLRRVLPQLTQIAVQNQTYADRLIDMGADPEQVVVTGSIKFDRIEINRENVRTLEIRKSFSMAEDETIFIAGSTQAPEEELALLAYSQLRTEFPRLRLMIVHRHKERFEEVAAMVERHGVPLVRRSRIDKVAEAGEYPRSPGPRAMGLDPRAPGLREYAPAPATLTSASQTAPVLLLDTLGELSATWGLADIAFVGGSLTRRGGQNMIEPAGYGAAVLFGPHTHNFKDVVALLLNANAARVVPRAEDLAGTVREFLINPQLRREMGDRAQQLVTAQRGATQRTVELIVDAVLPCSISFRAA
jgi:3-deoxy-D-manno-octulosonic-acid transferase